MHVEVTPTTSRPTADAIIEGGGVHREESIKSKILSHFVKGKVSLTPMETVMMIPGELEHLENLVKVARRKKDAEAANTQVSMVSAVPALRRLCISKTHKSKTLHLSVEVNQCLIEGLVDTGASMSVMATAVVRELGLMHLVSGSEAYKTASGALTQTLGRIEEVPIKVGEMQCRMTFMVVDTDSYDVLLGLDLLIKIGVIMDVEQGLIQVRKGPGADVEVLPLTMVNLMQRSDSATSDHKDDWRLAFGNSEVMSGASCSSRQDTCELLAKLESKSDFDSSESSEEATQLVGHDEDASEFGDTEFEELVKKEGPQQILQLTMRTNADDFMKEELTDADDYADWIQWADDEERRMQGLSEAAIAVEESVLLQVQQMEIDASNDRVEEHIMKNPTEETRWGEICQKIRIDQQNNNYGAFWSNIKMCSHGTKGNSGVVVLESISSTHKDSHLVK
jgi:predicted aspartyl protease